MQPRPGPAQGHDVAVGPNRVVAAKVFSGVFEDVHLTSYADFRTEVGSAPIRSVGMVGAPETADLLADLASASPPPERILIGLDNDLNGRADVLAALAACPRLRPAELAEVDGTVVVRLASAAHVAHADAERILAVLHGLMPAPPEHDGTSADLELAVSAVPGTSRTSRRRWWLLAVSVVLLAVAVLLVT